MWTAEFYDLVTGSNSNGGQFVCRGRRRVYVDQIPVDAPQDWEMGPKQAPGKFGVYLEHLWYPARHGPYAIVVTGTAQEAMEAAAGQFVGERAVTAEGKPTMAVQRPEWREL